MRLKSSEHFKAQSEYYKSLRQKNIHNHHLGTSGYDGKIEQWEAEGERLTSEGISIPWIEFPQGRSRNWQQARSTLFASDDKAKIIWCSEGTKEVSDKMKQKVT